MRPAPTSTVRTLTLGLAATTAVALAAVASTPAAAVTPVPATITATPDTVMVNTTTVLVGRGLPKRTTVHVVECAASSWYVLANPCDTTNAINVKTTAKGTFRTTFKVGTCPTAATIQTGGGPAFHCYIGVPRINGIDTESLQPGTSIIVTYP